MTHDLFTPPERRPAPEHLRARILAEVETAPAVQVRPRRRWIAPVVAAGVAVAGIAGAVELRTAQRAVPSIPGTQPPLPSAQAKALLQRCTQLAGQRGITGTAITSPSRHTVLVPSGSGTFALCSGDGQTSRLEAFRSVVGPDGVRVVRAALGGDTVLGVGGPVPKGTGQALMGSDGPSTVAGGYWVSDRVVATAALADEPDGMGVLLATAGGKDTGSWAFPWPGGSRLVGPTGAELRASCEPASQGDAQQVIASPSGHALVVAQAKGQWAVCHGRDGGGGAADEHGVFTWGGYAQWEVGDDLLMGTLPAGATGIRVRTPQGVQRAVVRGRRWLVENAVPPSQTMLEPANLYVEVLGPRPSGFWIGWKWIDQRMRDGYASGMRGQDTDEVLRKTCALGSTALVSQGGHVALRQGAGGSGLSLCSSAHDRPTSVAVASTDPAAGSAFALHDMATDSGANLLAGGGVVPPGVTGITFESATSRIPATISHGHWVHEQLTAPGVAVDRPTSVRLTGPGLDRTVHLP